MEKKNIAYYKIILKNMDHLIQEQYQSNTPKIIEWYIGKNWKIKSNLKNQYQSNTPKIIEWHIGRDRKKKSNLKNCLIFKVSKIIFNKF